MILLDALGFCWTLIFPRNLGFFACFDISWLLCQHNALTSAIEVRQTTKLTKYVFSRCLVKNPDDRATATELLVHPFIINTAQPATILSQMIAEAKEIRENLVYRLSGKQATDSVSHIPFDT